MNLTIEWLDLNFWNKMRWQKYHVQRCTLIILLDAVRFHFITEKINIMNCCIFLFEFTCTMYNNMQWENNLHVYGSICNINLYTNKLECAHNEVKNQNNVTSGDSQQVSKQAHVFPIILEQCNKTWIQTAAERYLKLGVIVVKWEKFLFVISLNCSVLTGTKVFRAHLSALSIYKMYTTKNIIWIVVYFTLNVW